MWNKILLAALVIVVLGSCSAKKKLAQSTPDVTKTDVPVKADLSKATRASLLSTNLSFTTFAAKAKSKVAIGKNSFDVTSNIRIEKDKRIWISISYLLGIEVGRILITPDSVQILNKVQGEYMAKPFSFLYQFASEYLTFENVQSLFLANFSNTLLSNTDFEITQADLFKNLVGKKNELDYLYVINSDNRPQLFRLAQQAKRQKLEANYSEYADHAGQLFPMTLDLLIATGQSAITAKFNYSRVTFNEAVEMPFSISSKYKVIH